jgi:hypothetical protein
MAIKYSDTPQLHYGGKPPADNWRERFPQHAQPIQTAPRHGGVVWVGEPSGDFYRAAFYREQWHKLEPVRDERSGVTRLRMTGEAVANPVVWCSS